MREFVHLLVVVAAIAVLRPRDDGNEYLVGVAATAVPMIDPFVIRPLMEWGIVGGPTWEHRSITHSLLVGIAVVVLAYSVGYGIAGLIGYSAALLPDIMYGGVKLFLPFSAQTIGFEVGSWYTTLAIAVLCAVAIVGKIVQTTIYEP